jgi:DNA-directed RNA polymerase subunit RPC12/RpoP
MSKPQLCAACGTPMLSVLYYGADGEALGGHYVCSSCGPRTTVEMQPPDADLRRKLLERKAS